MPVVVLVLTVLRHGHRSLDRLLVGQVIAALLFAVVLRLVLRAFWRRLEGLSSPPDGAVFESTRESERRSLRLTAAIALAYLAFPVATGPTVALGVAYAMPLSLLYRKHVRRFEVEHQVELWRPAVMRKGGGGPYVRPMDPP